MHLLTCVFEAPLGMENKSLAELRTKLINEGAVFQSGVLRD